MRYHAPSPLYLAALARERPPLKCGGYSEEQRQRDLARLEKEIARYERKEAKLRREQPLVVKLAETLTALQPRWAEDEECDITPLLLAAALKKLKLKLQQRSE